LPGQIVNELKAIIARHPAPKLVMALVQGRWTPEAAAVCAVVVMAPWDMGKPFVPELRSYVDRHGAAMWVDVAEDMKKASGLRLTAGALRERLDRWCRRLGTLPTDPSGAPVKLPRLKLRPGRRRDFTSGEILAGIRSAWWGDAPTKPTLLLGLALCPFISKIGGKRPKYRLNRVPRTPEEWTRAAGTARFVHLGERWFELGRIPIRTLWFVDLRNA